MMHVTDMLPTLAGRAGASLAGTKALDGMDQWATISTGAASPRTEVVYNVEMFRGAVRQGDWKLVWRVPLPAKVELFDIAQDPQEKNNVATENPEAVARLQARIGMLAGEMAKSQFFGAMFQSYMGRHAGPPVFPNEDGFYEQGD